MFLNKLKNLLALSSKPKVQPHFQQQIAENQTLSEQLGWSPEMFGQSVFDDKLVAEIIIFQRNNNLDDDGLCGLETFEALLAKQNVADKVTQLFRKDAQLDNMTENKSDLSRLVRCVGQRKETGSWNKHIDDYFGLDGGTFGIFHFASANAVELFNTMAKQQPEEFAKYFGQSNLKFAQDLKKLSAAHSPKNEMGICRFWWLKHGWWQTARQQWVVDIQMKLWYDSIISQSWKTYKKLGWTKLRGLATIVRYVNSGGGSGVKLVLKHAKDSGKTGDFQIEYVLSQYKRLKANGEISSQGVERQRIIRLWCEEDLTVNEKPELSEVDTNQRAVRTSGIECHPVSIIKSFETARYKK